MTGARQLGFIGRALGMGRRRVWLELVLLVTVLIGLLIVLRATRPVPVVHAQSSRDAYRDAFKTWRETDPSLERDAATNGAGWAQRTEYAAAAAARYSSARAAFLRAAAGDTNQSFSWLKDARQLPEADFASAFVSALDTQTLVSSSTGLVSSQISTYADEPDVALVPLRQALERERAALVALSGAVSERQKATSKLAGAGIAAEKARTQALESYQSMATALTDAAAGMDQESLGWAEYYRKLAESAQISAASATPAAATAEVRINNPARNGANAAAPRINNPANPVGGAPASGVAPTGAVTGPVAPRINSPANASVPPPELAPRINNPAPQNAANASALIRFTGSWIFPPSGGLYHGPQADTAALELKEEAGQISGTLDARFWPFGDIPAVSTLHFDFSGTPGTGRVLSFPLVTKEGAKGNIDLIPGPAFNLLEINFYTERRPGKISQGNLLLLKK
jgi:hypothetical protein